MSRRLLATYAALALAVLAALEIPLGVTYGRSQRTDLENRIKLDALTIATLAEDSLERGGARASPALATAAGAYARSPGGRVVVVDRNGTSLLDTGSQAGRNFASRPEIGAALRGNSAVGSRHSKTLGADLLFVAVPVASGGRVHGAVRVTYPTSALDRRVRRYWLLLAAIAGVVLIAAILVGLRLSRTVTKPLKGLEDAAQAAGEGDLSARAPTDVGPPEIQALAERFNEMVARLDVLVGSQRDFVADASHQLRTPLTALRLRLENLEHDLEPDHRAQLQAALAEVERLGELVDGLLALARADAAEAHPVTVALTDVVEARLQAWSAQATSHGVKLYAQIPDGLSGLATPGALDQILDNLLANALAISPEGGTVRVLGTERDSSVELHITDEGPGMTSEQLARAFDRFWREGAAGGTGLGLAIARRLVETDGGELVLASAAGGGLEAIVRLRAA